MIEQTGRLPSSDVNANVSRSVKPPSALRKFFRFSKQTNSTKPKITTYLVDVNSYDDDNVGGEFGSGSGPYDTENSSIIDSGCSQGCSGGNLRHVAWTDDRVVVQGYGDNIPRHGYRIGTFAMVARNTHGQYIMLVFHQYAGREDRVRLNFKVRTY